MTRFKRFKYILYLYMLIRDAVPIYGLYVVMFSEQGHLSTQQISWLLIIWVTTSALSELPSGIFADYFKRKVSLILSHVLIGLCFTIWLLGDSFWVYALGFVIWGIGWSFTSGALQAYVYDESHALGKPHEFTKLFTRMNSIGVFGAFLAYVSAFYILQFGYDAIIYTSIFMSVVAAAIITLLPEERVPSKGESITHYLSAQKRALISAMSSPIIWFASCALAVTYGLVGSMEEYVPLYYTIRGLDVSILPIILAVGLFITVVMSWYAHHLKKYSHHIITLIYLIASISLFALSWGSMIYAIAGLFIFMRLMKLAHLLQEEDFQHLIKNSNIRAAVTSIPAFLAYTVSLTQILIFGTVSELFLEDVAMRLTAALVFLWMVYYHAQKSKLHVR